MPSAFVLGVDLDGTCADFYNGLRPIAAEWLGVPADSLTSEVSWDLPEWGVARAPGGYPKLHHFAVTQRDLFRVLQPMPGAPQALRQLSDLGVRIRIITHRLLIKNFHRVAVQQTVEWLDGHDIPYWDLCFLADKSAVGADLYVEDSPRNVAQLRAEGHPTIVFTSSTNRHLAAPRADTWDEVLRMVTARMGRRPARTRHAPLRPARRSTRSTRPRS
ncbi:MAG: 5'-nucleotidase [Acidobacteria bacterium]|nr:5'-nucleotidase [Acidobacteriota bacterium]